jgi:hypothetical protein
MRFMTVLPWWVHLENVSTLWLEIFREEPLLGPSTVLQYGGRWALMRVSRLAKRKHRIPRALLDLHNGLHGRIALGAFAHGVTPAGHQATIRAITMELGVLSAQLLARCRAFHDVFPLCAAWARWFS